MMKTTIHVKPSAQVGEKWGASFGAWKNPDHIMLEGFETAFDAWAFVVAHTMIDPFENCPNHRQWTNRPEEVKPKQMKMFMAKG